MGLSASMWASVSGLQAHGDRMNVISNNLSNVNTVGFKGSRLDFEDFMSQSIGTAAGIGQMGRGTRIGIVMGDYSEMAFETTNRTTDIGISGNGFFAVRPDNQSTLCYTRAGNFDWSNDGKLVDPHGYAVQGWKVDNSAGNQGGSTGASSSTKSSIVGSGTPQDITLDSFSSPARHTTNMSVALNLDSSPGNDNSVNEDNPFFSLLSVWDATPDANGKIQGLGEKAYAQPYTMDVFDEGGQSHKITIYFDRVTQTSETNIEGMTTSDSYWEYIVTMDPSEDLRDFGSEIDDKYKGLLMSGTMTFDSAGQFKDMSSYVPTTADLGDMSTWVKAPLSNNGYPLFSPNFSGHENASSAWNDAQTAINPNADGRMIELNFGLRSLTNAWGGDAPATISDWSTFTDDFKAYKSDKKAGTVVDVYDENGSAIKGVVGSDGKVYQTKTTADTHEVLKDGIVYKQKSKADGYTAGKNEVLKDGYIYSQLTASITGPDSQPGTFPVMTDGTDYWAYDSKSNQYQQVDATGANPTGAWGPAPAGTLTKVADTANPAASDIAVPGTDLCYRYTDGQKIRETVTHAYTGMGTNTEHGSSSFTAFKGSFYEISKNQDGYSFGQLQSTSISTDGIITGHYSNGQTLDLYQITLYNFPSNQGLRREGGNMFSETRDSGIPTSGAPGTGSFGKTSSNSLEQSNVDLGREFVNMITTQRGYQANSKAITTVDTMMETVIGMKR